VPQQTGLKALYWRTQNLEQQPQLCGINPKQQPAKEGVARKLAEANVRKAAVRIFFMVVGTS
jgi:hypothetical protein